MLLVGGGGGGGGSSGSEKPLPLAAAGLFKTCKINAWLDKWFQFT